MATCEQFQAQLLDDLYELLEADERRALAAHLEGCGGCQAALARARSQQELLAKAAKAEFAEVRFQRPPTVAIVPQEERLRFRDRTRSWSWAGWAVAASILVLVGLGVPGSWWTWRYVQETGRVAELTALTQEQRAYTQQLVSLQKDKIAKAETEIRTTQEQLEKLTEREQARWNGLQQELRDRQLKVVVTGPQTLQPGASNEYQVQVRNRNNQFVPARLDALVVNAKREVVFAKKDVPVQGTYRLTLPPDLPLKPAENLALQIAANRDGEAKQEVRHELTLASPVYLTHLYTDKPMYRPGETVHFRSLTLDRFSLKPAQEDFHLAYTVTSPNGEQVFSLQGLPLLTDEKGQAPLLGPDKKPVRGIGAGDYLIPPDRPGGEYTLTVREAQNHFPPQERKFIVNQYQNPRLDKKLDFTRKSYGPGDEIVAACTVSRVEGGAAVANRPVTATVQLDGKEPVKPLSLRTDDKGAVNVRFKLPAAIERGQGSLSVNFDDGGSIETLVRSIPIVLKKLQVEFFPEGGDLITGVPNRVYFQARTMLGKPAELRGRIVDQDGQVAIDHVQTLNDDKEPGINQGMGVFAFTPQAGRKYELEIDTPSGMEGKYELPRLKDEGVALSVPKGMTGAKEPIGVVIHSSDKDRALLVGAYCRGRLMDHQTVTAKKGMATEVELNPGQGVGGVYRLTVFEQQPGDSQQLALIPKAERLIYRSTAEQLILTAKPDHKQYIPGEKVELSLACLTEKERPAPAVLLVSVVDKSVITMADEKTARAMPTHYLLTSEVRRPEELEYADILLGAYPKAAQALDLLLGTQGWRRFAEQSPGDFRKNYKDDAERLLALNGQSAPKAVDLAEHEMQKLQADYVQEVARLNEQGEKAVAALTAAQSDDLFKDKLASARQSLAQAERERAAAADQVDAHLAWLDTARSVGRLVLGVILLVAAGFLLLVGIVRRAPRAIPYYVAGAVCSLMLGGLVLLPLWERQEAGLKLAKASPTAEGNAIAMSRDNNEFPPAGNARVPAADLAVPRSAEAADAKGEKAAELFFGRGGLGEKNAPDIMYQRFGGAGAGKAGAMPPGPGGQPEGAEALRRLGDNLKDNLNQAIKVDGAAIQPNYAFRAAVPAAGKPQDKQGWNIQDAGKDPRGPMLAKNLQVEQTKKREVAPKELEQLREKVPAARRLDAAQNGRAFGLLDRDGRGQGFGGGFGGLQGGLMPKGLGLDLDDKKDMRAGARGGRLAADRPATPPLPPPLVVREYAHLRSPGSPSEVRSDFVDTVYWNPVLVLPDGKGKVAFDLCDSVTSYQVTAFGHTLDGRLGAVTSTLEARLPFTLEPKLPIEVTASDKIDIPVSIANNTSDERPVHLRVQSNGLALEGKGDSQLIVKPDGRTRKLFRFRPSIVDGQAGISIEGKSDPFTDSVTRTFRVVPDGFPIIGSQSDVLEKVAENDIVLPETWIKNTLKCQVNVYPSTLASLEKGLEALLREPNGCFEQTSTSNYPNLLILNYLKESDQAKPEVERRARDLLGRGYQKLVSFECLAGQKKQGYEWFGGTAPAHEALTAYGLLQFRDMARVYDVDKSMVERTKTYLMSRKDGKGGFLRNPRALDTFGRAPDDITNAYIVWALTESGKEDDVEKELAALSAQAKTSKDPYFLSLVATSLINRGKAEDGVALLKTVAGAQKDDGHLEAAKTSITGSGGRDLQVETTALAVLGWLKANRPADFNSNIQKAIQWVGKQRGGHGAFGSTQSTILALKAIIAYTKANKKTPEPGELQLYVGDRSLAHLSFPANVQEALVLNVPDPEKHLKPGKNSLRVEITGKNTFPYTLTWSYQTLKPTSSEKCPVRLDTRLDRANANEGETVHLTVTVENAEDKGQGMAVAIVGLPAGLTLPEDMKQLKDHARLRDDGKEKGLIGAWETRGREVILYWRDLAPKQKIEVPLDLICRVPGEYRGPASRAYLYYNADMKHWVEPLGVTIKAKAE
jgi:hypothetical protein